jgi:hypothetical protein
MATYTSAVVMEGWQLVAHALLETRCGITRPYQHELSEVYTEMV